MVLLYSFWDLCCLVVGLGVVCMSRGFFEFWGKVGLGFDVSCFLEKFCSLLF